jgi:hypothetical protein
MENSAPMAGRAILMEEAMKGGRNAVRVAMARAHSLFEASVQNGIDRMIFGILK